MDLSVRQSRCESVGYCFIEYSEWLCYIENAINNRLL